jgi:phosphonate transport system ATP-binding protein
VYQQFHLVDGLQVVHNVNAGHLGRWSFFKSLMSLVWPQELHSAAEALARVGIPEKIYERTGQLSGGQQQRVAIARVLVQRPQVILADEPVASLDPERGREIMDLLRDLNIQTGSTLVTSLHHIDFARSHCERIVGLRAGRVLFDARVADVTPEMIQALYQITPNIS